jgi:hypothetical protein
MTPGLTLYVGGGHRLDEVCRDAQNIADTLKRSVGFTFNSVRCVAMPGGDAAKLAEMQQEASRSEFVVYSNSAAVEFETKDRR